MIVYDVVCLMSHEAARNSSYKPGRELIAFRDNEAKAREVAALYNDRCNIPGIRYYVNPIDEESPDREYKFGEVRA